MNASHVVIITEVLTVLVTEWHLEQQAAAMLKCYGG